MKALKVKEQKNHFEGHRARLKDRFASLGADGLADYELLELLLTYAIPRRDVKPIAKGLILHFGSLAKVFEAEKHELVEVDGIGDHVASLLILCNALGVHTSKSKLQEKPHMNNLDAVIQYLHARMDTLKHEEFHALFFDAKNGLIADETLFKGSTTGSAVYPKEVIRKALAHGASSLIIAHNHPSGDITPSIEDEEVTMRIAQAGMIMDITLHDHLIIGKKGHYSFAENGKI